MTFLGVKMQDSTDMMKSSGDLLGRSMDMTMMRLTMAASMAGLDQTRLMNRYDDYGTINHLCDPVLGVIRRDEWTCPDCGNHGEGEEGMPLSIDDKDEHLRLRCPLRKVTCAACGVEMKVSDRLKHAKECKGPVVVCNRCGAKVRKCYVQNHLKKCVPFGQSGSVHLRMDSNCQVVTLMEGGVADKAGIQQGDVVVKVTNPTGTHPVASRDDFLSAIGPRSEVFKGTTITIHVLRDPAAINKLRASDKPGKAAMHIDPLSRQESLAVIRRRIEQLQASEKGSLSFEVTMGPETVAARETRRKALGARLEKVFPKINADMIDEFMTDPQRCKERVLEAFINADEAGEGALGPNEMLQVFNELAKTAGIEAPSKADCMHSFREVDVDGNGLLTLDEFFPYLRAMIMEVIWAEGPLAPCPRCRRRTRERNLNKHLKLCCGDMHPRGSLHFDVPPIAPLEVTALGPAAKAAGMREGDVLVAVNGTAVNSRTDVARVCSPAKGVICGTEVELDVKRRGTSRVDKLKMVLLPMDVKLQVEVTERLTELLSKKLPKVSFETIEDICLGGDELRERMRDIFQLADDTGSGFVGKSGMKLFFRRINEETALPRPSDDAISAMFAKIESRKEGTVSFDEILPVVRLHYLAELEQYDKQAPLDCLR